MSSRPDHPVPTASDIEVAPDLHPSDGRAMRRQRNMAAVRAAVLDVLQDGQQPTLAAIADRAGVATRSVYRYFGDVESAIDDAVTARRERAVAVLESEPPISVNASLAERLSMLVLRRLRLDRLIEPLDASGGSTELDPALDAEVRAALAPELACGDPELDALLRAHFRLRSVRAMREVFGERDQEIASAMMRSATAVLVGHGALR